MAAIQTSGLQIVNAAAGTTFTFNMPANFTAGNSVILACSTVISSGEPITGITVNGTAMVKDGTIQNAGNTAYYSNIWRCQSVAGGGLVVVVTFTATGGYFAGSCEEWPTLATTPLDQSVSGPNDNVGGNLVLTTGSKAQNSEIVYGVVTSSAVFGGGVTITGPTFGFTATALNTTSGAIGVAAGYKEVSAAGTETATWTTTGNNLTGILVTYKKVVAVSGFKFGGAKKRILMTMAGYK